MTKLEELDEKLKSYHPTEKEFEHARIAQMIFFIVNSPFCLSLGPMTDTILYDC